jgi:hypothetical protein
MAFRKQPCNRAEPGCDDWRSNITNGCLENVEVKIELCLTSDTYRHSSPDAPELVAITTITNADALTLELREEQDNSTILEEGFRIEHFTFYDLTTNEEVINTNPFPSTYELREDLYPVAS